MSSSIHYCEPDEFPLDWWMYLYCQRTISIFYRSSCWNTLIHHGMILVGVPYSEKGLTNLSEMRGGSPYGAGTLAGADGGRTPSAIELQIARFQGQHVATLTRKFVD